jgi:hypothetical protein
VRLSGAIVLAAVSLLTTPPAFTHCDALDGPVVTAARSALEEGEVSTVLKWIPADHEREVREVFARTIVVRRLSPEAKQLADTHFFETLVRIHRASEGAPFTGLKPAGIDPGAAVRAADKAFETGSVDALVDMITDEAIDGLRVRFRRAKQLKGHDDATVEAGRQYVHAYVEFVHYVERLHGVAAGLATPDSDETAIPHR